MKKRKKMRVLISIVMVLLLFVIWFCIPYSPLKADFEKDVEVLQTENQLYADSEVFTTADFEDFPIAIQKYIENNGYIGKSKMN